MIGKTFAVAAVVLASLALASCGGTGDAFEELGDVADVRRGTPTLVFVYTDG